MNGKLQKVYDAFSLPVYIESAVERMESEYLPCGRMTPLHGLYAEFCHTACSENCFNKSRYYSNRCMTPLCFARWLALKGYAKFNFKELEESIGNGMVCLSDNEKG